MFWGLTPALDLLSEYQKNVHDVPEELNILILGGADARHVLKTLARRYRYKHVKLNFVLIDGCVELLAKQLLLLNVALQSSDELGPVQKTRTFMELYGNTIVRPYVSKFLASRAIELIKMITNYDYLKEMMPYIELDIKYKDRDYMENLIKFWCSTNDDFDICDSWDRRLRKTLGVRYDTKAGAFDWDLNMRFHQMGGSQVRNQEYKSFRSTGIAFSWLESEVSKPNRSLVCAILPNGENFVHYGYLGDMQTGPFVTYGLECEDGNFLKSTHGQRQYRATDVTERNLRQIFHEIENKSSYEHQTISDAQLGTIIMAEDRNVIDIKAENKITRVKPKKCIELEDVKITFMSITSLNVMKYRGEFKNCFNVIYCGSVYLKHLSKELINNISAEDALMMIENQRFVLSHRDKQLEEYANSIKETTEGFPVKEIPFDAIKDDYCKFILKKS